MARHRRRDAWAVAAIALVCGVLAASPALDALGGLSIDVLTALRWQAFGLRHDPAGSPAVVVVIDEPTYEAAPFKGSPTITWTGEVGRVLTALVEGGARVVGFDLVFPASIEQSAIPFGDAPLGARLRGFDREFLRALHAAAAQDKVVLGEVRQRELPIGPAPGQRIAVGPPRNVRALNAYTDPDDVVRRLPTSLLVDGRPVPSMAVELAARALGVEPVFAADGTLALAGYRVPARVPRTMTLGFDGGADDIPTHSLADLRACAAQGERDHFRRHFEGKVVLLGTLLDTEDRRITSKRFATGIEHAGSPRCALPAVPADRTGGPVARRTIAGVYLHATAVNNLIRHDAVRELGRPAVGAVAVTLAALGALAAFVLAPAGAVLATLALAAAYLAGAVFAFRDALALPLVEPFAALLGAQAATIGYRVAVADRGVRLLRRSFALYLAPPVIERMLESERLPALGGETREVTLFFSDIAGFSTFAETLAPPALVRLMNDYLSAMTEVVEANGGYVDKYVGDSIVALFGAPLDDAGHARHGVRAALQCGARLEAMNRDGVFQGRLLAHRIGIHTGPVLVGNIGSRRRFNYTVMGDAVNLASRLEGANKVFGTTILVSETTVAQAAAAFDWREIDALRVKGRAQPVRVFEPLAEAGRQSPEQAAAGAAYAAGLAAWRARDFGGAATQFALVAASDPPAARFERRALVLAAAPPGADWEPILTLDAK